MILFLTETSSEIRSFSWTTIAICNRWELKSFVERLNFNSNGCTEVDALK